MNGESAKMYQDQIIAIYDGLREERDKEIGLRENLEGQLHDAAIREAEVRQGRKNAWVTRNAAFEDVERLRKEQDDLERAGKSLMRENLKNGDRLALADALAEAVEGYIGPGDAGDWMPTGDKEVRAALVAYRAEV